MSDGDPGWMDKAAYVRQFPVGQEPTAREIDKAVTGRQRMAWTPEMNVMVESMIAAEIRARRELKRAWSRVTVGEQAEMILKELRLRDFTVAEVHTVSLGRAAHRKTTSGNT